MSVTIANISITAGSFWLLLASTIIDARTDTENHLLLMFQELYSAWLQAVVTGLAAAWTYKNAWFFNAFLRNSPCFTIKPWKRGHGRARGSRI
jgi:hypothetical protein